ncbi:MAG: NlpC/P60 family protein [Pseudomonadota bacterium]
MRALDPRLHAVRADLAAERLRGVADAPRYAAPVRQAVRAPRLPMFARPGAAGMTHELIRGAEVDVYDEADGFAWLQAVEDGYVGYAPGEGLGAPGPEASHRVCVAAAPLHATPELKTAPLALLPMNARLAGEIVTEEGAAGGADRRRWLRTEAGCVPAPLVAPLDAPAPDWVAVAERLIGAPYVWGGATPLGLDCSALVQIARRAAGLPAPRDSDMQAEEGSPADPADLRRGDLAFWRGHVGVMTDAATLLHCNAHHMAVAAEPLAQACARIEAGGGGPPTAFRRLGD